MKVNKIILKLNVYSDGACRGNPGAGAIGIVFYDEDNNKIAEYKECIGECTNNQAEYQALIKGLDLSARYTRRRITVYCDCKLLINQMNGVFRLKNDALRDLYHQVKNRERIFDNIIYQYVQRGNQRVIEADRLNSQAQAGRPVDQCCVQP